MLAPQLLEDIKQTVTWALCEDLGAASEAELKNSTDITAELIPKDGNS